MSWCRYGELCKVSTHVQCRTTAVELVSPEHFRCRFSGGKITSSGGAIRLKQDRQHALIDATARSYSDACEIKSDVLSATSDPSRGRMEKLPHTTAGPQNAANGSEVRVPERKRPNPVDRNKKPGQPRLRPPRIKALVSPMSFKPKTTPMYSVARLCAFRPASPCKARRGGSEIPYSAETR